MSPGHTQARAGSAPGPRWLSFSGYDWWVKSSDGLVGPGPNYFSDSTNNVWLDGQGQLHLRITNRSNQWQCAELVSARTFGYGSYRFQLASPADNLNPNAVLGLFTWSDDPAHANREIDIECSRWGNAADPNNTQYVVQPYNLDGHLTRIDVPAGQTNATLMFTWETNRVSFQSQRGSFSNNPSPANVISNWTYALAMPPTGDENVRLNLWLFNGAAPTDSQEVEVVISSFQFVPLGAPQPGVLRAAAPLPPTSFASPWTASSTVGMKSRRPPIYSPGRTLPRCLPPISLWILVTPVQSDLTGAFIGR